MKYKQCKLVSECCCNHMGDLSIAKDMIKMSKICNADYVKFQKRCPELSVPKEWHSKPHPNPNNAFGKTYLDHRKALEFTLDQHKELFDFCENLDIKYVCSVWDMISAQEIISLNPDFIKIPSACNTNYDMMNFILDNFDGDIHVSLGMMKLSEKEKLFNFIDKNRFVVYWTTSEYPVPFERLYLREIENLCKIFPRVGYSGHNYGISVDVIAYTLGVEFVERHFTLDRTAKGTDQAASLEPDGLRRVARDLKAAYKSLKYKDIEMTDFEIDNRRKLKGN